MRAAIVCRGPRTFRLKRKCLVPATPCSVFQSSGRIYLNNMSCSLVGWLVVRHFVVLTYILTNGHVSMEIK
jgi:hypothetical protein